MYGIIATAGASEKTLRSAASGTTSSFWMNFTPSATSCAQPWNDAGLHRPEARLHVREHLVLHVADRERHDQEEHHDHDRLRAPATSQKLPDQASKMETPVVRPEQDDHSSSSSSPSTAPGQGLASRVIKREVLAQRMALERLGQQQLHRLRVALEPDPEHLERLALVPVAGGPQVGDRGQHRVLVRAASPSRGRCGGGWSRTGASPPRTRASGPKSTAPGEVAVVARELGLVAQEPADVVVAVDA